MSADLDGLCFTKRRGVLTPSDAHSEDWLASVKEGGEVMMTGRLPRNPRFHRLAMGLFRKVLENDPLDRWADADTLLDDLKERTKHGRYVVNALTGERRFQPKSISFAAMSEDKFKRWFDRAVWVLATEVLHVLPQELADEVLEMVDGPRKAAA